MLWMKYKMNLTHNFDNEMCKINELTTYKWTLAILVKNELIT